MFAQRHDWNPKGGSYPPLDTSGYGPIQEALETTVGDVYVHVLSPSAGAALKEVGAAFRESDKGWGGQGYSLSENQGRRGIPFHRVGTGELTPSGERLRCLVSHEPFALVEKVVLTLVGDEFLDDSQTRLLVANATRGGVLSQGGHADAVVVHKHKVEEEKTHEQLRWLWMGAMAVICFVVSFENGNYGIPREGPLRGIFACVTLELPASAIYALTALLAGQKTFGFTRIGDKIYKLRIYHLVFGIKEQRALTVASVLVPLGGAPAAIVAADQRIDALARRLSRDDVLTVAELFPLRFPPCVVGGVGGLLDLGGGGSVLCYGGAPAVDAEALAAAVVLPADAKKLRREDLRAAAAAREAMRAVFVRSRDARGARALLGFSGHDTAAHDAGANALADLETLVVREARRLRELQRQRDARAAETPAQREARLKPSRDRQRDARRDARDALLAKHGSFCRCKNSKCLKRYCLCFERGVLCGDSCKCENCENVAGSAALRKARAAIAEFPPSRDGCTCKNSRCLKRYCECFKAGLKCVAACKCVDCHNGRPADAPAVEAIAAADVPVRRSARMPPKKRRRSSRD